MQHAIALSAARARGPAGTPYRGRVFALLDRNSGSSGERAAVDLRRALGAVLVGERTAGCMQYGQAVRFVLPHTGLVLQLPTRRFFFEGEVEGLRGEVEGVGFPVDVYLEDIGMEAEALLPHLGALERAAREARTEAGGA